MALDRPPVGVGVAWGNRLATRSQLGRAIESGRKSVDDIADMIYSLFAVAFDLGCAGGVWGTIGNHRIAMHGGPDQVIWV